MKKLSNKIKIIIVVGVFLLLAGVMFLMGYSILGSRNQAVADSIAQRRLELAVLQREQKNVEQGKKDLTQLQSESYPPDELFSSDTKVVKEIQQLESAARLYSLNMTISISGTSKTAVKATGVQGEIYVIPYTLTLNGTFDNILQFTQAMEHLPFVTHVNNINVAVNSGEEATTIYNSEFYITK